SYLKQVSSYLSDGFKNRHLTWNTTSEDQIQKPVIILAANSHFYDTLQASMHTINDYLKDYTVAIYDLQFSPTQLNMIKENCVRCIIIPFPFAQIDSVAPHIRSLGNFAWKPIVIQDAVRRFSSIIYGDTSIRYKTSNFDRLLIDNLIRVSSYLSDGFKNRHLTWNTTSEDQIQKPVIILAANLHFYDRLQASMHTVNDYLKDYTVAIYDLQFSPTQLNMIKENCVRCIIIPFPFAQIDSVAPHIRSLGNFAWKPIVIQDAVRRFGSIIYGDTSIRYKTSNFDRLLIDNLIRGFSCRELPGHYLPCFTLSGTFSWFNETFSTFDDVYIAEAGFLAVTDNFLSRLILKTWVTCALDSTCITPSYSRTQCKRVTGLTEKHRYDQSAMVTLLSFYFFPSPRQNGKSDPAPYDMYTSMQERIAEVRRFEGDKNYLTRRKKS
ncbi:unnamed protein product, partial [Rotaria sordida]